MSAQSNLASGGRLVLELIGELFDVGYVVAAELESVHRVRVVFEEALVPAHVLLAVVRLLLVFGALVPAHKQLFLLGVLVLNELNDFGCLFLFLAQLFVFL